MLLARYSAEHLANNRSYLSVPFSRRSELFEDIHLFDLNLGSGMIWKYRFFNTFAKVFFILFHIFCRLLRSSSVSFILVLFTSFGCVASDLRLPSPLACAVGPAAIFAVNAARAASQRQHRTWTVCLQPHITPSTRLDRPQVSFFKSAIWPNRESNATSLKSLFSRL